MIVEELGTFTGMSYYMWILRVLKSDKKISCSKAIWYKILEFFLLGMDFHILFGNLKQSRCQVVLKIQPTEELSSTIFYYPSSDLFFSPKFDYVPYKKVAEKIITLRGEHIDLGKNPYNVCLIVEKKVHHCFDEICYGESCTINGKTLLHGWGGLFGKTLGICWRVSIWEQSWLWHITNSKGWKVYK